MALIVSGVATSFPCNAETIHSIHNAGSESTDYFHALAVDSEGNVLIGGALSLTESGTTAYLAKFHPNGSLAWDRTFSFGNTSAVYDVAVAPSGEIYVLCDSDIEMFLTKLTSSGDPIWTKGLAVLAASYRVDLEYDGFTALVDQARRLSA